MSEKLGLAGRMKRRKASNRRAIETLGPAARGARSSSLQLMVRRFRAHVFGIFLRWISAQVSSRAPTAAQGGATNSCRFMAISAVGFGGSATEAKVSEPAKSAAPSMAGIV